MDTISLHTCRELLIKTNNSKFILLLIVSILGCFCILLESKINAFSIIAVALIISLCVLCTILHKKRQNKLKNNKFHIAEDVFINVERVKFFKKPQGKFEICTFKFSKNGTYEVNLYEKREPEKPSCDYSAVHFSKPGDKVYLLILEEDKKNVILKCFNAKYYKIFEDDFEYKDGKYFPKINYTEGKKCKKKY